MRAKAIINHDMNNSFQKKSVFIDGDEYFITNSVPDGIEEGIIDYHPDYPSALYIPDEN